jgi:hypothetical protein
MGLKAVLDTLDGVDESLKGFYQQADGKFRLDIEGGYKLPSEIEGLTSALGKERQRADELAKAMKSYEGLDAKAARDALAKVSNWDESQQKNAEKMELEFQARLQPVAQERDTFKAKAEELEGKFRDFSISNAINSSKLLSEKVSKDPVHQAYVREHFKSAFKMEDGKIVAYDSNNQRIFNADGNPAGVDEALEKLVMSHPQGLSLLAGSNASGSGAKPQSGSNGSGKGTLRRSDFDKLSPAERVSAIKNGVSIVDN